MPHLVTDSSSHFILRLKMQLLGIRPSIWRSVLVPVSYSLHELHGVIQVAMGWESVHLYRFWIADSRYGSPDLQARSASVPLSQFGLRRGSTFLYEYDMGDFWQHRIRVEGISPAKPESQYPACVGGAHACPPEDCGGPRGYEERRHEAMGMDAWDDYDTMVEAIDELVLKGNSDFLKDEDRMWQMERAVARTEARQPFLSDEFSVSEVNERFRRDDHHELMYQQCG